MPATTRQRMGSICLEVETEPTVEPARPGPRAAHARLLNHPIPPPAPRIRPQGTRASDGAEKAYRPMSARIESGRNRQFGSIDNFKPQAEARRELSAAGQVKAQHLGGTVSLRDEVGPAAARNSTRVTQAPGGTSQIVFG